MSKRIRNILALFLLPVGLVALLTLASTYDGISATKVANVANSQSFVPQGVWSDLPVFPTVILNWNSTHTGDPPCVGWASLGTLPLKLKRAAAVAYPPNGKVYIMGGRHRADGDDMGSQWIWEYTPGGSTYVRKNAALDSCQYGSRFVSNMAAAYLTDANGPRIYLVGGSSVNSQTSNSVRVYDPVADTLTSNDAWPASPGRIPGGYAVYANKLYIFGGYSVQTASTMYADTWVFDPMAPSGSRWSLIAGANLGTARTEIAGATLDGYIYAIGGDVMASSGSQITVTPQTIVERMNPLAASPTWQTVASLPSARGDMGVWAYDTGTGYEVSGHIVVAGGPYPVPDSNAYIYDPGSDSWSTFTSMPRARRNVAYTQWGGILYAFGGYNVLAGPVYDGSNTSMQFDSSSGGTPLPTNTAGPSNTPTRTNTTGPSNTPTRTNTALPTNTSPPPPTNTPTRTNTPIPPTVTNTRTGTVVPPTVTNTPPPTNTPTRTNTSVPPTNTATRTNTSVPPTAVPTNTLPPPPPTNTTAPTDTSTPVPPTVTTMPTPPACTIEFTDVPPNHTFYPFIHCMACQGIVNGYTTGCETGNPCFRPENNVTRGQIAKIVSNSGGYDDIILNDTQTFEDVVPNSTFWVFIERLAFYEIMDGYPCGDPGEPCRTGNKPYFRPSANATRGQIAKIVSNSAGFNDTIQAGTQTFEDAAPDSTFWLFIERLLLNRPGAMNGYPCGGPGEQCMVPNNRPYFRPNDKATRGQVSKIVSNIYFPDCVVPVRVKIQESAYHPASIAIAPGTTVRFINRDPIGHTATDNSAMWDTDNLEQNQFKDVAFAAGSYSYYCIPHSFMQGTLTVDSSRR